MFYRNLKKENWKRLTEDAYGITPEQTGFADTGIHMDYDNVEDSLPFHNTTIQFEPETEPISSAKKDADVEYVRDLIETIKADLDEIASKLGQVQMTEDEVTGVVSYNYLFDNHTVVNTVLDVATNVQSALTEIKGALSSQTTEEQQMDTVTASVNAWNDSQAAMADAAVEDVVVVTDEVGQYEDETPNFFEDEEIVNDILNHTHSIYGRR